MIETRVRSFRRYVNFIGVACKVRHKSDCCFVLGNDALTTHELGGKNILKKSATGLAQKFLAGPHFGFNRFEDEVRRINLTVRVWVRNADRLSLIFEDQHMADFGMTAEFPILFLPDSQKLLNFNLL